MTGKNTIVTVKEDEEQEGITRKGVLNDFGWDYFTLLSPKV
jgi:hypothetical protein